MNSKIIVPILGIALLSGGLLGCQAPDQANASSNKVNASSSQEIKPEQKLMEQAQDKLKELTGNTYTLVPGTAAEGVVNFKRENFKYDMISYKNGKPDNIGININYEDLNGGKYQAKLESAWKALFPGEGPKYVNISESIYRVGTISANAKQNKQVYMKENEQAYGVNYAPDAAPASVQKKSAQVLSKLTNGKVKAGAKLDRVFIREGKPKVYRYKYKSNAVNASFAIEEQTLQILQAGLEQHAKAAKAKQLTPDALMKNAMKDAKTMIELDLKGYKGARGANAWDKNEMTFTKKGAPTVTATVNTDGSFNDFIVEKYGQYLSFTENTIVGAPNEEPKLLIN
ncbi:hypothetical protein [Paenibacillus piscarius]|uniref:hypothetical protein n=1 Tax=Paenibacillus piscarius TaxID=1089681 RepID=UPI001EE89313|nr:hypothetical protein [Paenibacillus piscarius]